jgi:hypothetical protein
MCTRGVPERLWAAVPRGARALVIAAIVERVDSSAYSYGSRRGVIDSNTHNYSKRACDRPLTGVVHVGWCVVPLNGCVRASDRRQSSILGGWVSHDARR